MAEKPKTAAEYLAQATTAAPVKVATKKPRAPFKPLPATGGEAGKPLDPLSWLVDIISRPLYGVTNTIQNGINTVVDNEKANQQGKGDFLQEAGSAIKAASPLPFLEGMFSNDPKVKRTFSDVIEQSTDKIGSLDPSYKDTQDNVNPWVKGIAGFVGDVGLDPLTYIPGAAFATIGRGLVKGGKAAKAGVTAAKKVIEDNVDTAASAERAGDKATAEVGKVTPELPTPAPGPEPKAVDEILAQLSPEELAAKSKADIAKAVLEPKGAALKAGLGGISALRFSTLTKAIKDTTKAKPLEFKDWLPAAVKATAKLKKLSEAPKVFYQGKRTALPVVALDAEKGSQDALIALRNYHEDTYLTDFATAKSKKVLIDPLSRPIKVKSAPTVNAAALKDMTDSAESDFQDYLNFKDAVENGTDPNWVAQEVAAHSAEDGIQHTPESVLTKLKGEADSSAKSLELAKNGTGTATTTILNSLQNFRMDLQAKRAVIEEKLGKPLVHILEAYRNPISFDKTVSQLKGILDASIDVNALRKLTPPAQRMLTQLGVDPAKIPLGMRTSQSTARVEGGLAKVHTEDLLKKMADDGSANADAAELAAEGLKTTVRKNLMDPQDPSIYGYETAVQKTLRTEPIQGEGVGRNLREANTFFQADSIMAMIPEAGKMAAKAATKMKPLFGASRAEFVGSKVREGLRLLERAWEAKGVPLVVGVGFNNGEERLLLGASQFIDVLEDINHAGMRAYLWNNNTAVPITNLFDAVFAAVRGGTPEDVGAALRNTLTAYGKEFDNHLASPVLWKGKNGKQGMLGLQVFTGDQLVNGLTDTIMKAVPTLRKVVDDNAVAHAARKLDETKLMTKNAVDELTVLAQDNVGVGNLLAAINDTTPRLLDKAKDIGALQESVNVTQKLIEPSVTDAAIAKAAVDTERIVNKATKTVIDSKMSSGSKFDKVQEEGRATAQKKADTVADEDAQLPFDPSGEVQGIGGHISQIQGSGFMARMFPMLDRSYNNKLTYPALIHSENWKHFITARNTRRLTQINAQFTPEQLAEGFRTLQKGIISTDPATAAAAKQLEPVVNELYGVLGDFSMKDNAFFRENASIHHMNAVFQYKGLDPYLYDVEAAVKASQESGRSIYEEAARQWVTHDVKDPIDYLNKVYDALATVNAHQSIAHSFQKMARDLGATSYTPKAGYARFVPEGKSVLAKYLPTNMYYEKSIAQQLAVTDAVMRQSLELTGPFANFIKTVYGPVLKLWKTGMTIVNPVHHIRNAISDKTLTFMALGATTRPVDKWAFEALATHNSYTNLDAIKVLNGIGVTHEPGRVLFSGKLGQVTGADLYAAMASRGNLPMFSRIEDIAFNDQIGKGAVARTEEKIVDSRFMKAAGSFSEGRDHYTRLAHAAQMAAENIDSSKYKTLDDLWDAVSESVRKWHPDGSGLTPAEQVARLVIPFYSWQRRSIPLVVESMLTHPARVMAIPKASYNLAVAMGINPNSLSDPFPTDQMFPSYLTDMLDGPQLKIDGKYYGINPGFATNDALNTYLGNNPLQSVIGQVSPFIRTPFELATGRNAGTGADINDYSDYIDSQTPILAPVSRLTGNSVTGSIANMFQGKGLDPQYQIAQGNKDPGTSTTVALLNYLTGAGLTPMSQPNQINYAEIEKRNAASKQGARSAF